MDTATWATGRTEPPVSRAVEEALTSRPPTCDDSGDVPEWKSKSGTWPGSARGDEHEEQEAADGSDISTWSTARDFLRGATKEVRDAIDLLQAQAETDIEGLNDARMVKRSLRAKVRLLVMDRRFEWAIAFIIFLNSVYIGIETQTAMNEGIETDMMMPWFALDLLFVSIFLSELLLRLYAERSRFFCVGWNLFDFGVVLVATIDKCIITFVSGQNDVLDIVNLVRILRIARILRIIRLLRFCRELWLIVLGIFSSMRTLFWAWMFIALMCYIGSVFITRTVGHEALDDPEVQYLFGTVARSLLTLFQVLTVDDWVDIVNVADRVGFYARPFFVLFVVCTTFAVLNVVIAVIVEKTLENSMQHSESQIRELTANLRKSKAAVHRIFLIGDSDDSGSLSKDEFMEAIRKPEVMRFLHEVGLDLRRVEQLFDVLDYDESGVLEADEFVEGVMEARGEARSKDVLELQCDLWRWEQTMKKDLGQFRKDIARSTDLLNEEVKAIKDTVGQLKESIAPML